MHEYQITQQIIKTVEELSADNNFSKLKVINLCVGESSGYLADSIELYFDILSSGTICEGALLKIEKIKPKIKCNICGTYFERKLFSFDCPVDGCGGLGEPTNIGRDFYIKSIEV